MLQNKIKKIFFSAWVFLLSSGLALIASAAEVSSTGLQSPLKEKTVSALLLAVLGIITQLAIPVIVLFLIYAGFLFVKAGGNETEITKARNAFKYIIIGAILILGANVILEVLQDTYEEISSK